MKHLASWVGDVREELLRQGMRTAWGAIFWCLMACFAAASAETRIALVVANSDYANAPLANPKFDLDLVTPALTALGFEVTAVRDADLSTFDTALADFATKAKDADVALFYFAGHGFAVNDGLEVRNYLMSTSADVAAASDRVIRAGGIPLDEIIDQLGVAKTALIFVDACRNDPRAQRGSSSRGLAAISRGNDGSIFVGLSTRVGDTAADGVPGEGSPFARAFVEHIGQPNLRVDDAFTRVRIAVEQETRSQQRPDVGLYELDEPVVLRVAEVAPEESVVRDEALAYWDSIKQTESVAILKAFAEAFPDSLYARLATARIEELSAGEKSSGEAVASLEADVPQVIVSEELTVTTGEDVPAEIPVQLCDTLASTADGMFVDYFSIDPVAAIPACEAAERQFPNEGRFSFQLGRAYQVGEQYRLALAAYRRAAESGEAEAMTIIGQFYADGIVEEQDCEVAKQWYAKAVRAGDASRGLRGLGNLYSSCPAAIDARAATEYYLLSLLYGNDETLADVSGSTKLSEQPAARRLQQFLTERGFYDGSVDGQIGPATVRAAEAAYWSKGGAGQLAPEDAEAFELMISRSP